ncbi:MAG: helix-turn-helix transcriptional regulator [Veillonellaceae bacterium]|nr:helix-turn-helix transcriptional regulator [Veillonellaceae bacterium]
MKQEEVGRFPKWLQEQLDARNITPHKLAKRAGISHSVFSRIREGKLPNWKTCLKIATALDVDPVYVLRIASLLPVLPAPDADFEQLRFQYYRLSPLLRRDAIRILRAIGEDDE